MSTVKANELSADAMLFLENIAFIDEILRVA